jgi:phosphonate metabolism protein (transferase hexapeptide repeat family)
MPFIDSFPEAPKEPREPKLLSEQPTIHPTATVRKSEIGGWTAIGPHCSISESTFGDYSYLAGHVSMVWTDVGKFASIAAQTRINPGNHPTWRVTQHHSTYRRIQYGFDTKEDTEFFQWRKDHRCSVGHDVWIGHGVTVIAGKKIGTGAVIGSGAVVTKDIPPYAIAVGVPARVVKYRFPKDVIEQLQAIAWWDWDRATLVERFNELLDLESFVAKYGSSPVPRAEPALPATLAG